MRGTGLHVYAYVCVCARAHVSLYAGLHVCVCVHMCACQQSKLQIKRVHHDSGRGQIHNLCNVTNNGLVTEQMPWNQLESITTQPIDIPSHAACC